MATDKNKIDFFLGYRGKDKFDLTHTGQVGVYNGYCFRSSCQKEGATWFNRSTQKYYCRECAQILNEANKVDAMRLFGLDLCVEVGNPENTQIPQLIVLFPIKIDPWKFKSVMEDGVKSQSQFAIEVFFMFEKEGMNHYTIISPKIEGIYVAGLLAGSILKNIGWPY